MKKTLRKKLEKLLKNELNNANSGGTSRVTISNIETLTHLIMMLERG